jgi:hypothetical protein
VENAFRFAVASDLEQIVDRVCIRCSNSLADGWKCCVRSTRSCSDECFVRSGSRGRSPSQFGFGCFGLIDRPRLKVRRDGVEGNAAGLETCATLFGNRIDAAASGIVFVYLEIR